MNLFGQFLLYNLMPSLLIGLFAWLIIIIALKYLPIYDPTLRLSFLGVPVLKSAIVLLGGATMLPWPPSFFNQLQANALPFRQLLPALLIWAGLLFLAYLLLAQQVRRQFLQHAYDDEELVPRLEQSLQRVRRRYHQNPVPHCDVPFSTFANQAPSPQLLVSDRLPSPTALTEGKQPIIIFPAALLNQLTDEELDGALAHELGHFILRRHRWCSTTLLRRFIFISPGAAIVSAHLSKEEEMACDDIAVDVVGRPDVYAETLLKSYRFAQSQSAPMAKAVWPLPQLLGIQARLSTRIERLIKKPASNKASRYQYVLACFLWFGLALLFFSEF